MCNKRDYLDTLEFEYSFTFRRYLFVKAKESINQMAPLLGILNY